MRVKNLVESHHNKKKLARQNKEFWKSRWKNSRNRRSLLVQTEKMASLGRMSAGIMHEINNPLNYATTGLCTLRNKGKLLAPEHKAEYDEILHDVEDGITRVKSIVSDLKTFTHPDTEQKDEVDVAVITSSALRFLSNEWKEAVRIEQKLAGALDCARQPEVKLLRVIVNLLQ